MKRNDLCWCGSGKKYKNCHLNRETQQRLPVWEIDASVRKLFGIKACLHPLAGPTTCRSPMIKAHSVRRSADLKVIARNGHVYQGFADLKTLDQTGGMFLPRLIGINSASTFSGFCQEHDTSTFSPLETQPIGPTDEQAFLLAYRPLSMELYLKQRSFEGRHLTREADKGQPIEEQYIIQRNATFMEEGLTSAITDLQHHKSNFDKDLLASDFSRIQYVVFHLDRAPEIMCSGVVQPEYTFDGKQIQDLSDFNRTSSFVSFSLMATDNGGAGVFSWRDDSDREASMLVDSLLSLFKIDIPAALVRFALSTLENTFFSPDWWEKHPKPVADSLVRRINYGVGIKETHPFMLRDDGIRPVSWKVINVQQKRA